MSAVRETSDNRPQLLFFHDPTDGRARRVEGFIAQVIQHRHNHNTIRIRRINVREHAQLAERFRLRATPALLVVHQNAVQARLEQPQGCRAIQTLLKPWLR